MSARLELMAAGVAALLAHGALLGLLSPMGAAGGGGGSDGRAAMSLSAGNDAVASIVETWETSPLAATDAAEMNVPPADTHAPVIDTMPDALTRTQPTPLQMAALPTSVPDITFTSLSEQAAPVVSDAIPTLPSFREVPPATPDVPKPEFGLTQETLPAIDTATEAAKDTALQASPRPSSRPSAPAQIARDSGEARQSGRGRETASQHASSARSQAEEAAWASAIQRQISRYQRYPRGARGVGRVRLAMVILADGRLSEVRVTQSSGVRAFDQAALQAAERAAPFPAAPKTLQDDWYRVAQWVSFSR